MSGIVLGSVEVECAQAARVLRCHAAEQERRGSLILGVSLRQLAARLDALAEREAEPPQAAAGPVDCDACRAEAAAAGAGVPCPDGVCDRWRAGKRPLEPLPRETVVRTLSAAAEVSGGSGLVVAADPSAVKFAAQAERPR